MGLLDRLGNRAMNALDAAVRLAEAARETARADDATPDTPATATTADAAAAPASSAPKRNTAPSAWEIGDASIPAQVFGRMSCPWTQRVLRLLTDREIEHVYTELQAPGGYQLAPRLKTTTGQMTVPYVYLRGRFVGGYDAVDEIDRLGQLDDMVKSEAERAASAGSGRIRIRVAPREP